MNDFTFFLPLTKADEEKHLVWGRAAVEEPDKSKEIMDYLTAKPQFQVWSDGYAKATMGKSFGNIRAMHNPKHLAGKVSEIVYNDDAKAVDICVKVLDPVDWNKVAEGGYTGFSIGGGYLKKWTDSATGCTRYTPRIQEISFVDSPCIPGARIMEMQKRDGSYEEVLLKGAPPRTFAQLRPPPSFAELRKGGDSWKHIAAGAAGGISGTALGSELYPDGGATGKAVGGEVGATLGEVAGSKLFGLKGAIAGGALGGLSGSLAGGVFGRKKKPIPGRGQMSKGMLGELGGSMAGDAIGSKIGEVIGGRLGPAGAVAGKWIGGHVGSVAGDAIGSSIGETAPQVAESAGNAVGKLKIAKAPLGPKVRVNRLPSAPTIKSAPDYAQPLDKGVRGGFRAMRTGHRLPGIHYGGKHAPKRAPMPGTSATRMMQRTTHAHMPAAHAAAPARAAAVTKRWDGSKHPREHTGHFASKTSERVGRFALGSAGAVGGYMLGTKHGERLAGQAARRGALLYHRLRGSSGRVSEAAEMAAGRLGHGIGREYGHLAGAGVLGLGGALAGGAAGALIDRGLRYRRAKKAGRLDVYRRLNAKTSSKPNSFKQVKASTKRAVAAGKRINRVAERVMGKNERMDFLQKGAVASSLGRAGIAAGRYAAHKALPKYAGYAAALAGGKGGYKLGRVVGGHMAHRMARINEGLGIVTGGAMGHGPGLVRHGEHIVSPLGHRLTARQKKILIGTLGASTVGGAGAAWVAGHQATRLGAQHIDRKLSERHGRPRAPGERGYWEAHKSTPSVPGTRLLKAFLPENDYVDLYEDYEDELEKGWAGNLGRRIASGFRKAPPPPPTLRDRLGAIGTRAAGLARANPVRTAGIAGGVAAGGAAGYAMTRGRRDDAEKQEADGDMEKLFGTGLVTGAVATGKKLLGAAAESKIGQKVVDAGKTAMGNSVGQRLSGYATRAAGSSVGQSVASAGRKVATGYSGVAGRVAASATGQKVGNFGRQVGATIQAHPLRAAAAGAALAGGAGYALGRRNADKQEAEDEFEHLEKASIGGALRAVHGGVRRVTNLPGDLGARAGGYIGEKIGARRFRRHLAAGMPVEHALLHQAAAVGEGHDIGRQIGTTAAGTAALYGALRLNRVSQSRKNDAADKQDRTGELQKNILLQDDNTISQWRQARSDQWESKPFWSTTPNTNDPKQTVMPGMPAQAYGPTSLGDAFKGENPYLPVLAKASALDVTDEKSRLIRGARGAFVDGRKKGSAYTRANNWGGHHGTFIGAALGGAAGKTLAEHKAARVLYGTHPAMQVLGQKVAQHVGEGVGGSIGRDVGGVAGAGVASLVHDAIKARRAGKTRFAIEQLSPKQHAQRVAAAKARWKKEMPHADMEAHHKALEHWAGRAVIGRDEKIAAVKEEAQHFWHHVADAHDAHDKMRPHVPKDAAIIMRVPHSGAPHSRGDLLYNPDGIGADHFTRFGKPTKRIFLMHPSEVDDWIEEHGKRGVRKSAPPGLIEDYDHFLAAIGAPLEDGELEKGFGTKARQAYHYGKYALQVAAHRGKHLADQAVAQGTYQGGRLGAKLARARHMGPIDRGEVPMHELGAAVGNAMSAVHAGTKVGERVGRHATQAALVAAPIAAVGAGYAATRREKHPAA